MNIEKKPTTPWKPSSLLNVHGKDKNYRYRWIRKDNLEKAKAEGWEICSSPKGASLGNSSSEIDGTKVTTVVEKRNLILCRMPEELAQSRQEYYTKLTSTSIANENSKFVDTLDGNAYGGIKTKYGG